MVDARAQRIRLAFATGDRFGAQLQIIATGGIDAPDKAREALDAGATACAYFTGFITRGPILARLILDHLLTVRP